MSPDNTGSLIRELREEAASVKDCFTRFSFQAMGLTAIVLGIVARYQKECPPVALTCIYLIAVLLVVARIGTHKYGTANRNFGYQLHLERTKCLVNDPGDSGWNCEMRLAGWEEVMRAWRIVQATIFEHLCVTKGWYRNRLRREHRSSESKNRYRWFEPRSLARNNGATYYAGSYLRNMLLVLYMLSAFALVPMVVLIGQMIVAKSPGWHIAITVLLVIVVIVLAVRYIVETEARRELLENGILSIHSCAIAWQAVVVAHYRALKETQEVAARDCTAFRGYTENLAKQARALVDDDIYEIHRWIHGSPPAT